MQSIIDVTLEKFKEHFDANYPQELLPENGCLNVPVMLSHFLPLAAELARIFVVMLVLMISQMYYERNMFWGDPHPAARLKDGKKTRTVVMEGIGAVTLPSPKYYDPETCRCFMLLNEIMGFQPRERVQERVKLQLLEAAAEESYRKSAESVLCGEVSYGTVKNVVHSQIAPELAPPAEKRQVKELLIAADEAHVHMMPAAPGDPKRCQQLPLVTIAEGREQVCKGRHELVGRTHFTGLTSGEALRQAEAFIHLFYDLEVLETIYVYGDGAAWICQAFDDSGFHVVHVHDSYHRFKMTTQIHNKFPRSKVRLRIQEALETNDRSKLDKLIHSLRRTAKDDKDRLKVVDTFETYFTNHWEGLVASVRKDIPKSFTEPMVYHALAVRFTTNPSGWSLTGLINLARWRLFALNGGNILECRTGIRPEGTVPAGTYLAYIKDCMEPDPDAHYDWSVFIPNPRYAFDGNSGTRRALRILGRHESVLV